jgi:hypothetical protein
VWRGRKCRYVACCSGNDHVHVLASRVCQNTATIPGLLDTMTFTITRRPLTVANKLNINVIRPSPNDGGAVRGGEN